MIHGINNLTSIMYPFIKTYVKNKTDFKMTKFLLYEGIGYSLVAFLRFSHRC